MALFWDETFEPDNWSTRVSPNGTKIDVQAISRTTSNPRTGTTCASNGGGGWYIIALGPGDQDDTLIAGMPVRLPNLPPGEQNVIKFYGDGPSGIPSNTGTTWHIQITLGGDRKIRAYRGFLPSATLLGTSDPVMPNVGQWYGFEVKVKLSDTVGIVEVRVDNVTVLELHNVDTKNGGTANVLDRISFDPDGWYFKDDLYVCNSKGSHNTDFLGAPYIVMLAPNGNGNSTQGVRGDTGTSVNNYTQVDEAVTSPSSIWPNDYIELQSAGDKDTYAFDDVASFTPERAVPGLLLWDYAYKTDANTRPLAVVARHGGSESSVTTQPMANGSYSLVAGVFEQRPDGGDWTVDDINAAEFGHSASAGHIRSAAMFADVLIYSPGSVTNELSMSTVNFRTA